MTLRFFLPLALLLTGCVHKVCLPGVTRCLGVVAEVCLADHTWKKQQDCAEVARFSSGVWVCCDKPRATGTGANCVPENVCR